MNDVILVTHAEVREHDIASFVEAPSPSRMETSFPEVIIVGFSTFLAFFDAVSTRLLSDSNPSCRYFSGGSLPGDVAPRVGGSRRGPVDPGPRPAAMPWLLDRVPDRWQPGRLVRDFRPDQLMPRCYTHGRETPAV